MKFVLQEFYFVQGVQTDCLPLVEFLPISGGLDKDEVLVLACQLDLSVSSLVRGHYVDSRMFPRYVGGVNLQQRSSS